MAKKMVLLSVIGTIVAMIFMAASILFPHPLLLVLAMSIGQGIAIFALVLYLLFNAQSSMFFKARAETRS